jgi:flagellar motor switch protein FliM
MSDQVLTDDEKQALLEGVASGEVEVQTFSGPRYAKVRDFVIPERSRLATNSFPRLQRLNWRFADRASRLVEQLVNADVEIVPGELGICSYGEYCDRNPAFSLVVEFAAPPLPNAGLIYIEAGLVRQLVEAFYGGEGNEPAGHAPDTFTPGESNVAALFCKDLLATLGAIWEPLIAVEHKQAAMHLSSDIIDGFETSDAVITADFAIEFSRYTHAFHLVWPKSMLAPLLPVFEGQKRERDAAQDAYWEQAIRARVVDSKVVVASLVGHGQLTLGAAAELKPGDVIDIGDAQKSTLCVKNVPVLEGTFGVHDGHYAVEAGTWLAAGPRP